MTHSLPDTSSGSTAPAPLGARLVEVLRACLAPLRSVVGETLRVLPVAPALAFVVFSAVFVLNADARSVTFGDYVREMQDSFRTGWLSSSLTLAAIVGVVRAAVCPRES
jgi:hypothetical protein